MPVPQDLSPNDLMREGINQLPGAIAGDVLGAVSGACRSSAGWSATRARRYWDAVDYARSGRRVMGRAADPSPLLRRRSLSSRSEAIEMKLAELRAAAHAAGGSINDAYLAGLCGALRLYHEALGVPVNTCRWRCR